MPNSPKALGVNWNVSSLTLSNYTSGSNKAQNRLACVAALKGYTFTVSLGTLDSNDVPNAAADIELSASTHGVVWALATAPASNPAIDADNWPIVMGAKVCLDLKTLKMVTGFNPNWGHGEYKVVGIALDNWSGGSDGGVKRIPILLTADPYLDHPARYVYGTLHADLATSDATASVDVGSYWDGVKPVHGSDQLTVNNTGHLVSLTGAQIKCVYNDELGQYEILDLETKATTIWGTTTDAVFTSGHITISSVATAIGGITPTGTILAYNGTSNPTLFTLGGSRVVCAVYDKYSDKYYIMFISC